MSIRPDSALGGCPTPNGTTLLALLNPEGNDKRDNLNNAALEAGESMEVDFRTLCKDRGMPLKSTVTVLERTDDYATVHLVREYLR